MNLYLDTSSLIKIYHFEKGSERIKDFLKEFREDLVLTISKIAVIEMHSAFMKKARMKEIDYKTAINLLELFKKDLEIFNVISLNEKAYDNAIDLINNYSQYSNLRTLDSLQLSSAIISNAQFKVDLFSSSDNNLITIAKNYFNTVNFEN